MIFKGTNMKFDKIIENYLKEMSSDELKFSYGKNGSFKVLNVSIDGKEVGELVYSLDFPNKGEINIEWIEVSNDMRRRGIAEKMIKKIQEKYPDYTVTGRTTSDKSKKMFKKLNIKNRTS